MLESIRNNPGVLFQRNTGRLPSLNVLLGMGTLTEKLFEFLTYWPPRIPPLILANDLSPVVKIIGKLLEKLTS